MLFHVLMDKIIDKMKLAERYAICKSKFSNIFNADDVF